MPDLPWEPQNPYILYGYARGAGSGEVLVATNRRTGEIQQVVTQASGLFALGCENFATGYLNHDVVDLVVVGMARAVTVNIGLFPEGQFVEIFPPVYNRRHSRYHP